MKKSAFCIFITNFQFKIQTSRTTIFTQMQLNNGFDPKYHMGNNTFMNSYHKYNNSEQSAQVIYDQALLRKQSQIQRKQNYQSQIQQARAKYQQKQQEKINQEQQENKPYVLKQFQNVKSRYMDIYQDKNQQQPEKQEQNNDKLELSQNQKQNQGKTNYIQKNYQELKQLEQTMKTNKQNKQNQENYNYGEVPQYIKDLKENIKQKQIQEEQERIQEEIRKQTPQGCRLVPEEERIELLKQLKQALYEECKRYNSFPLRFDNQSLQQQKNESGARIDELQETISQFERKGPLYIKI